MDRHRITALTVFAAVISFASALSGSHVCTRAVSSRQKYYTCCGWTCWSRCSRYRTVYSTQSYCCNGWKKDNHGGCTSPICSSRCQNGGTCIRPNTCQCDVYHSGSLCQRTVAYCGRRPCRNGGTCIAPEKCLCDLYHYGSSCQFKKSCNNKELELVFLLDSSGYQGQPNFDKLKSFVKTAIEQFDISENKTRIGLITYSRYPFIRFGLNDNTNMSQVLEAVDNVPYIPGLTETHTALQLLRQEGFKESRSNVPHVAVLITAGKSLHPNETESSAQSIHRTGIEMVVVGIGDRISKTELGLIATNPNDKHLILVHNYTMITDVQEKLTTLTCDVSAHSYTPSSTKRPVVIQSARREPIKECVGKEADIVFLLDSSQSLGTQHFKSVEHFALDIVNDLDIGENSTMVGVVSFSTYPVLRLALGSTDDKLQILNTINQIQYYPGTRETDKALQLVRIEGFEGERLDLPNILILLTDGNSSNSFLTGRAADELKQSGVEVFVVGVGLNVSKQELDRISSGGSNHVFTVHNFLELDLSSFEGVVAGAVCQAIPKLNTTATTTTSVSTTKRTSEHETTTLIPPPTKAKTASECMPDVKDVIFLVDSSGSIGDDNFKHIKDFIKQTITTFDIGLNKTRVGLILFNSKAVILFPLDRYDTKQDVLGAVENIGYRPGGTNTADALQLLRTQGFTNDRPEAPNIAFLITDGYSTDKNATEIEAILAKENNSMQIFATGIGQLLDFQELRIIASTNPSTNKSLIYHVDDFDELHVNSLEDILGKVICGESEDFFIRQFDVVTTASTTLSTTTKITTESCIDKVSNCDDYDEKMCTSYRPWAMAHCERYCGFCQGHATSPMPCVDTIVNCREYGHYICTSSSFRKWTKEHCARFCEFCGVDILGAPGTTTSTTANQIATVAISTKSANEQSSSTAPTTETPHGDLSTTKQPPTLTLTCHDKIKNCAEYGQDICTDYGPWAKAHCIQYCGFCQGLTTTPGPCVDTIGNCQEYPPDICTAVPLIKWTKDHCSRFCKICDSASP